jgi:RNA polymerase sigma factor (sigma-70 family)
MSVQEAEDVVSEVLLRAAERSVLEDEALARWLTAVTINVCADLARERAQSNKRAVYSVRQLLPEPSPEQLVVDRETAATVVRRLSHLPDRQREALLLRSAGFGVGQIAEQLEVSYKTAESLLSRARAYMRKTVVVIATTLLGALSALRRHTKTAPVFAAAVALAVTVGNGAILGWPGTRDAHGAGRDAHLSVKVVDQLPRSVVPASRAKTGSSRQPQRAVSTAGAAGPQTLVKPRRITTPDRTYAKTPSVTYQHDQNSLLEATARCLKKGPKLTPQVIGCPN